MLYELGPRWRRFSREPFLLGKLETKSSNSILSVIGSISISTRDYGVTVSAFQDARNYPRTKPPHITSGTGAAQLTCHSQPTTECDGVCVCLTVL